MLNITSFLFCHLSGLLATPARLFKKQEYLAEMALDEENLRQEKLEHLAYKFERKTVLREGYLNKMITVLSDPRYGSNLQ